MTLALVLHDWRMLERIVGLTHRLGCSYTRVEVASRDRLFHATIQFEGSPAQLRRLDTQLNRLLEDDKEMAR